MELKELRKVVKELEQNVFTLKSFSHNRFINSVIEINNCPDPTTKGVLAGRLYCLIRDFYEAQIKEIMRNDARRQGKSNGEADAPPVRNG